VPTDRLQQLVRSAFETTLVCLEFEPEVEQGLEAMLRPPERADGESASEDDFGIELQDMIESELLEALEPFTTLEGFGRALQQIGEARREAIECAPERANHKAEDEGANDA
jgi:hypothetical protein